MSEEIYHFLQQQNIPYKRYDHPPLFTCEDAQQLAPHIEGAATKNLFLRDKKGTRHFLIVIPEEKQVDMKALSMAINSTRLSFGSPERLKKYLNIKPGAVSLLALIYDTENKIEVFIDSDLWQEQEFQCHPLINTSTLVITRNHLKKFFDLLNHPYQTVDTPSIQEGL